MTSWKTRSALALVVLGFVASGMLFIPRLGIEVDEAIITNGIYPHGGVLYSWTFGGNELPLMLISYLGALKTWFYSLLFWLTPPGPISLRLPTLIAAAIAICFFFALLDRTVGRRAAWIGTVLLATDSSYLLVNAIDYGPVALQFLFKLAALLFLLKFYESGSKRALAGGFFLLGLALWDKAIFVWAIFGLALATVAVFAPELRRVLTPANVGIAALAMIVGALPLVIYNIAEPLGTLGNGGVEPKLMLAKTEFLQRSMEGQILFGFIAAPKPGPKLGESRHWYESLSLFVSRWTRQPHRSLTMYAAIACVLALPWVWRTAGKPILFGTIACLGTWFAMALTKDAGATVHHAVLVWPFHFLVIAAAVSRLRLVPAAAVTVLLCGSSLAVTNQLYADLIRNGPGIRWTDAMEPLQSYLRSLKNTPIVATDWGFFETMTLLSEGTLPLESADTRSDETILAMIGAPDKVFVAFAPPFAFQPQVLAGIQRVAQRENYEREPMTTIYDRHGRATFDVFRFRKLHL